ncbi:MAG: fumarate hydratase [Planctomycetota bacterium]
MKETQYQQIVDTIERLCIQAAYELPQDVLDALTKAAKNESNSRAKKILQQLLENADIAKNEKIPLCQDTGLAVVFVEQGADVRITPPAEDKDLTLFDAITEGVKAGYKNGYLRMAVVAEPLNQRKNTGSNTPAIIHHTITDGDELKITVMTKGGGCENRSQFKMFLPTADKKDIADWVLEVVKQAGADACPPFVVGVGIGGDFEQCCLLSKRALLRNLTSRHEDEFYASLEEQMLERINNSGIGPQGMGGDTTALGLSIETAPCHIASLPVAVNIECHSHRHKTAIL